MCHSFPVEKALKYGCDKVTLFSVFLNEQVFEKSCSLSIINNQRICLHYFVCDVPT